jgi:DNA end-binding protein Ku
MVRGPALVLMLMRFDHEILAASELDLPAGGAKSARISPAEQSMAERLVADMTAEFEPKDYKDTYHDDLLAFIKKKIKAGDTAEIEAPTSEPEPTNVVDIMSLLRRSLGEKPEKAAKPRRAAKRPARAKAPRRAAAKSGARRKTKKTTAHAARKAA